MCFHHPDNDVLAAAVAANAFTQHVEGLPDPWRVAQEELEDGLLFLGDDLLQPLLRGLRHVMYYPRPSVLART